MMDTLHKDNLQNKVKIEDIEDIDDVNDGEPEDITRMTFQ